jgi:hypothetical protein
MMARALRSNHPATSATSWATAAGVGGGSPACEMGRTAPSTSSHHASNWPASSPSMAFRAAMRSRASAAGLSCVACQESTAQQPNGSCSPHSIASRATRYIVASALLWARVRPPCAGPFAAAGRAPPVRRWARRCVGPALDAARRCRLTMLPCYAKWQPWQGSLPENASGMRLEWPPVSPLPFRFWLILEALWGHVRSVVRYVGAENGRTLR